MSMKKSIFIVLTTTALGIIALLLFWVPSFFADEFYNVTIAYAENGVTITPAPDELQKASLSKWTDVSATFKNDSNDQCQVDVKSASLSRNFALEKNAEFGLLLPKQENIEISFCGEKKDIRID
ncbi:MAG: hypothetical protein Q8O51_01385 [bacterium]|nr:hypothetical protein [bacterium]